MNIRSNTPLVNFAATAALVALSVYLLVVGQQLFLPLVIAIVFWFLINVLASLIVRLRLGSVTIPRPLCFLAAVLVLFAVVGIIVQFVSGSLNDLGSVARVYEANLRSFWQSLPFTAEFPAGGFSQVLTEWLDISAMITALALTFTGLAADGVLITIYVGFLLFEQGNFNQKLSALVGNPEREKRVRRIIEKVRADIQKYITIKLFTSALTGTLSYLILRLLGVNFPEVWGVLIFLLNFIPTVGSIIATIFPALIALAQSTDGIYLSLTVLILIGALQVTIGNIIEPRLMGTSLNLSPVVILFNLALWGYIWGVAGMFLCVPFLIITTIVLSHFPKTRPVAILLSSNGQVDLPED
ncbi:AI-2E family transporter [Pseudohongiella spirulinae]|uniref:Putative permease n=1 Tax=Pseudohongiella spirulinae TaxID=1249552 RepID=A0A0S2KC60_9GAMM|nr:AI-2E family transporter [Pseudohongiella spirulinae]ALO45911.1 Putative permease [Pseudohongiella spirulinae]